MLLALFVADVADGVNMSSTSPVSIEVNKGPPTPTSTLTVPSFINGK